MTYETLHVLAFVLTSSCINLPPSLLKLQPCQHPFLCHLRAFAHAAPSTWNNPPQLSFSEFQLKCCLLGEAFPDHPYLKHPSTLIFYISTLLVFFQSTHHNEQLFCLFVFTQCLVLLPNYNLYIRAKISVSFAGIALKKTSPAQSLALSRCSINI